MLAVAGSLACSGSLPPSTDIVFAVPLEDVLYRLATAGAESGSDVNTGADGATGALRRLLALMLNDPLLMRFVLSSGLLAGPLFACVLQGSNSARESTLSEQVCEQASAGSFCSTVRSEK